MDTQPSNPSDFEVLTAIVSRVCIGFMDLEQVFPHANPDDVLETLSRLRNEGRIDTFWARDDSAPRSWKNLRLAARGHLRDSWARQLTRMGYSVVTTDDD